MAQNITIACPECGKNTVVNGTCRNCGCVLWENDPDQPVPDIKPKEPPKPEIIKCPICGKQSVRKGICRECGYELEGNEENTESEIEEEPVSASTAEKHGPSGFTIFIAVVLGIVAAVWIITKIFHIEITGTATITPLR